MPDIVLTTLNSKYIHPCLSLLYIKANLGALESRAEIREFQIKQDLAVMTEELMALEPRIIMIAVYIWNVEQTRELVQRIKAHNPEIDIVIGGPEVSYAPHDEELLASVDYVVCGEGELAAKMLAEQLLSGKRVLNKMVHGEEPDVTKLELPYRLYSDDDIANRIMYIETSRGCPYKCEYCLSSIDRKTRFFDLEKLFPEIQRLLDRGVTLFKLLDRTFNTRIRRSIDILEFFLERYVPGMVIHVEFIPDRLPSELRRCIQQFPDGCLQFEIGVQSFNQEILDRIKRQQKSETVADNIQFLCDETGVIIHADLIIGLPGEMEESFADGFSQLARMYPQHIQINLLKLLKGTPIVRHTKAYEMDYDPVAPFEVQQTSTIPKERMDALRRFSRVWTLFHNQERFRGTLSRIWLLEDPYTAFMAFTDAVYERFGKGYGISLNQQMQILFDHLTQTQGQRPAVVAESLIEDYEDGGRRKAPNYLKVLVEPSYSLDT